MIVQARSKAFLAEGEACGAYLVRCKRGNTFLRRREHPPLRTRHDDSLPMPLWQMIRLRWNMPGQPWLEEQAQMATRRGQSPDQLRSE